MWGALGSCEVVGMNGELRWFGMEGNGMFAGASIIVSCSQVNE